MSTDHFTTQWKNKQDTGSLRINSPILKVQITGVIAMMPKYSL